MASTIWAGTKIQTLVPALALLNQATLYSGTTNPQSVATIGTEGDIYFLTGSSPGIFLKTTSSGTDTNWANVPVSLSPLAANSVVITDGSGNVETDSNLLYNSTSHTLTVPSIDSVVSGSIAIGTQNATTINIGNVGSTINLVGTVITEDTTTLNVTNPTFTVNVGAGPGSAANSGMQVNENNAITAYVETSSDRASWILKAPATAGVATITPGSSGIVLAGNVSGTNTGDVTIATGNGLSLSGQALSLGLATNSVAGALSASDHTSFSNKVSSVALSDGSSSPIYTITDSPVTSSGTLTFSLNTQSANSIFAGPSSGSVAQPTFRTQVLADLPQLTNGQLYIGSTGTSVVASTLTAGTGMSITNAAGSVTLNNTGVTSVGITPGTGLGVTNSPITTTGNIGLSLSVPPSAGDITETSFSLANNQSSASDVTGFTLSSSTVRSAQALYSVFINATSPLYEEGQITLINMASTWQIQQDFMGNDSQVAFTVTNSGQVQYVTPNYSGFSAGTMKFRIITTSV